MAYYPIFINSSSGRSSTEEECYFEIMGKNNNEMNSVEYEQCLVQKKEEDWETVKTGFGIMGILIVIVIFIGWAITR